MKILIFLDFLQLNCPVRARERREALTCSVCIQVIVGVTEEREKEREGEEKHMQSRIYRRLITCARFRSTEF